MTIRYLIVFISFCFCFWHISAQSTAELLATAFSRPALVLNGEWQHVTDPNADYIYPLSSETFIADSKLNVPSDWNSQNPDLLNYQGIVWYKTTFDFYGPTKNDKVLLHFGGIEGKGVIYLNGQKIGEQHLAYIPFNFEVQNYLKKGENELVIAIDNVKLEANIKEENQEFHYGGITRDVKLIILPATYIQDYQIMLDPNNPYVIKGFVQLSGQSIEKKKINLNIRGLQINEDLITDAYGKASFNIPNSDIDYWSPNAPHLYRINLKTDQDRLIDQVGFRTVEVQGSDILLNGTKIFLKGIDIKEEIPQRGGRAFEQEDAIFLLEKAKELGCNFVRLTHHPHNKFMVRMADRLGLMILEEISIAPYTSKSNTDNYNALNHTFRTIFQRDKNKASVIFWSFLNQGSKDDQSQQAIIPLLEEAKKSDPSRLITTVLESENINASTSIRTVTNSLANYVDALSIRLDFPKNQAANSQILNYPKWRFIQNKPVLAFGYYHSKQNHDSLTEFQKREAWELVQEIPGIQGFSPGSLMDFRSPQPNNLNEEWNTSGFLTSEGELKSIFSTLQDFYQGM